MLVPYVSIPAHKTLNAREIKRGRGCERVGRGIRKRDDTKHHAPPRPHVRIRRAAIDLWGNQGVMEEH